MKVSFLAQLAHNLLHFPWTLGTCALCSFKVLSSPFGHQLHHFYNYFQSTVWSRSSRMRHDSSQKCPDHLTYIFHVSGEDLYSAWDSVPKSWKMLLAMVSESLLESIKLSNGASQTLCTPGETLCLWHGLLQEHISHHSHIHIIYTGAMMERWRIYKCWLTAFSRWVSWNFLTKSRAFVSMSYDKKKV